MIGTDTLKKKVQEKMRINVLQHTPNEGPGAIRSWAEENGHELYVYHPYRYGILPDVEETDILVILGGPMSPNDDFEWLKKERDLIRAAIKQDLPIFGACLGAQQISKALGGVVKNSGVKEVGFAPVFLKSHAIKGLPEEVCVLHWHQDCFEIPKGAELLFSSRLLRNQGFVMNHRIVGLQFHFEPLPNDLREIVVNDGSYTEGSDLGQTPEEILLHGIPEENKQIMYKILDYISDGHKD